MSDKEQREAPRGAAKPDSSSGTPPPAFDEGARGPSPIESTGNDNVRGVEPSPTAERKGPTADESKKHTEATRPPMDRPDSDRNSM